MKKAKTLHKWTCPHEKIFLLKPETILLGFMVFLVFIFSFIVLDQRWIPTITLTVLFILVFILVHRLFRHFYPIQETYHLSHSGIAIHRQAGKKASKTNIKYSQINEFKLDKTFHGGRIMTKSEKHPLYFNSKEEIEKLEKILKKKIKKK